MKRTVTASAGGGVAVTTFSTSVSTSFTTSFSTSTVTTFSTTCGSCGTQAASSDPAAAPADRCKKSRRLSFRLFIVSLSLLTGGEDPSNLPLFGELCLQNLFIPIRPPPSVRTRSAWKNPSKAYEVPSPVNLLVSTGAAHCLAGPVLLRTISLGGIKICSTSEDSCSTLLTSILPARYPII